MIIRHIAISLLSILLLMSTGGIHYIFHQCLNTGEAQVHFTNLHGCCSDGDDHCEAGACGTSCCHTAHHSTSTTWQEECCIDDIHFLKTDETDQTRGLNLNFQLAGLIYVFTVTETTSLLPRQAMIKLSTGSTSPPDSPLRYLLCTYRT